jgi:hypothetical protein
MAVIARAKVSGLIRPVIWTKVHLSSGDFVRHGKTRSAKTGISVLLEMRRAIPVITSMLNSSAGRTFHMFECKCGDKTWISEKA